MKSAVSIEETCKRLRMSLVIRLLTFVTVGFASCGEGETTSIESASADAQILAQALHHDSALQPVRALGLMREPVKKRPEEWHSLPETEAFAWMTSELQGLREETYRGLKHAYDSQSATPLEIPHPCKLIPISRKDLKQLNGNEFWTIFRREYPECEGYVEFSPIGFSSNRNQAVVYYGRVTSNLGAKGELLLAEFQKGKWVIVDSFLLWIS